ncbi:Na(+)/H(+) antiporter subunit F1 [Paenibacillus sp. N4]|nr:Na(+)/H(+) antiporter subunit F1 [Paenibacillus vietnamensis]MCA0756351.1 Na(+)/H(+) antiporter subunit F1 [Paenibacillus vietnamensis]
MMSNLLFLSLTIMSIAIIGCMYRLLKGPSIADRIAALDTIGVLLLSMVAIICMVLQTNVYFDIILVIGILTFIGTTAFARYIERGVVIESGDDKRGG